MSYRLPPEITFTKNKLSAKEWLYVFKHRDYGQLGRIFLKKMNNGETQIACEVAGNPDDSMTAKRLAIFEPVTKNIIGLMGKDTGKTIPYPVTPKEPEQVVATKLMKCNHCSTPVALLIFTDDPDTPGSLEDTARLMHSKIKEFNVLAWVIGPPIGEGIGPELPADIIKIWPSREPMRSSRPDDFNAMLSEIQENHCLKPSEELKDRAKKREMKIYSINDLPWLAEMAENDFKDSREQYDTLKYAEKNPSVLDDEIVCRFITLFEDKLKLMDEGFYEKQFKNWKKKGLTEEQKITIEQLEHKLKSTKELIKTILSLAGKLEKMTINKIIEMDDMELAIKTLTGEIPLPSFE